MLIFCAAFLLGGMASADVRAVPHSISPITTHVFQPPRPQWIKEVSYLKEMPDDSGYEGFTAAERDPNFKDYHLEYRYFKNAQDQKTGKFCKILQYSSQGHLEEDNEVVDQNQYVRKFYANGSVASYLHYNLMPPSDTFYSGIPDGFSVSPVNHTVMRLTAGNGDLKFWRNTERTFNHVWYLNGEEYLTLKYENGICREKCLVVAGSHLTDRDIWTPAKETLETHGEYWTKLPDMPPFALVFVQANNPINQRIRERSQKENAIIFTNKPIPLPLSPPVDEQTVKDYAFRRAAFIANYSAVLAKSGHTWKSLNLENVLNGQ